MTPGRLLILSGPSGVGKDTLIDAWSQRNSAVQRVVAYTTREPRQGEIDGLDYNFVTPARFLEHVEAGDFLEHKQVHGNYYATPLKDMEGLLALGKVAVLKIDVQGALVAMSLRPDADSVFILPPDVAELERRIRARASDDEEAIDKRLENARGEMAMADRYAHQIVNRSIEETVEELEEIIRT